MQRSSRNKSNKLGSGRVVVGQVGFRCRFCKHKPCDERQLAAFYFPQSVKGVYEAYKRWQRVHLEVCEDIPADVRAQLEDLESPNDWMPNTRQYWADSATASGLVDTDMGIRFGRDPQAPFSHHPPHHLGMGGVGNGAMVPRNRPVFIPASPAALAPTPAESRQEDASSPSSDSGSRKDNQGSGLQAGDPIVQPEDMSMVPPYVYFLMSQVESCNFTEADRFVARSKGPVGYPGFQCRHCHGHAGLGKYFPVSAKSLATNSTSQNIHAHILKCRKCPPMIKEQLLALKEEKSKAPRLEPGWRKIFFDKLWSRLHGEEI